MVEEIEERGYGLHRETGAENGEQEFAREENVRKEKAIQQEEIDDVSRNKKARDILGLDHSWARQVYNLIYGSVKL